MFSTAWRCFLLLSWQAVALPPGFISEGLGRFRRITDISTIPLPEYPKAASVLMLTLKAGQIYVIEDPDNNPEETILAADFSDRLCDNGERGLQSAIAHPNFRMNRYVYVYYTDKGSTDCQESRVRGPRNRCVRYKMDFDYKIDFSTEKVLFQTSPLAKRYHNGGDMEFGPDGYLYISVGDGGVSALSQDNSDLMGTLVRLDSGGNIPVDNPFNHGLRCNATGQAAIPGRPCREIYAFGLRNAYKIAVDPNVQNETRLLLGDVGGQTWEETHVAGTDYPGANYGWPQREGPCSTYGDTGNNVEDCVPDSRYVDPEHFYLHRDKTLEGGGAIVGGAVIPNGYWPSKFDNGFFFADFTFGEIYRKCNFASHVR